VPDLKPLTPHEKRFTGTPEELALLFEITQILNAPGTLARNLQQILKILAQTLGMERGTITILTPGTNEIQIEVAQGLTAEARRRGRYKLGEGVTGRVVETGEPMVIPRVSQEPMFLNRTRSRGRAKEDLSFICVPIKINHQTIGALSVDRRYSELNFDRDVRLLTIIASIIAQAGNNLLLIDQEKEALRDENLKLKGALQARYQVGNLVGTSSRMRQVFEMITRVAPSNATILIRGESGTGKELVANAVHYNSQRADKPFIKVNLAALPETLVESELFGHEKGAFTGALSRKAGRFELAQGGTIFLDEIGDLSPTVQLKLLRVIQEREFTRLGGAATLKADVRLVAATHRDLERLVEEGIFREDLVLSLERFPHLSPTLRERKADIPLLAEHFLARHAAEQTKHTRRLSQTALDLLMQYRLAGERPGTGERHRAGLAGVRRRHHPERPPAPQPAAAGLRLSAVGVPERLPAQPPEPGGPGGKPGAGNHCGGPHRQPGQPEPGRGVFGHQPAHFGLQNQALRSRPPGNTGIPLGPVKLPPEAGSALSRFGSPTSWEC
jgi:Nif-specific regulatory protein